MATKTSGMLGGWFDPRAELCSTRVSAVCAGRSRGLVIVTFSNTRFELTRPPVGRARSADHFDLRGRGDRMHEEKHLRDLLDGRHTHLPVLGQVRQITVQLHSEG
jgi:hypothetical protein